MKADWNKLTDEEKDTVNRTIDFLYDNPDNSELLSRLINHPELYDTILAILEAPTHEEMERIVEEAMSKYKTA